MYKNFNFEINHTCKHSNARSGILKTPNGSIKTPAFYILCN